MGLIVVIAIGVCVGIIMARNVANVFMVVFGSMFVIVTLSMLADRLGWF
jgi:hypothetical protein